MRPFLGSSAVPIVSCSTTNFKTRFGLRKRPDFRILRWMTLSGKGASLPPTEAKPLAPPAPASSAAAPSSAPATIGEPVTLGTPVDPPTLAQEVDDSVPW
jgi:hypothetical protein